MTCVCFYHSSSKLLCVLLLLLLYQVMQQTLQEEPASLFVVGSYHIGKERAYLGAAEALGLKVSNTSAAPQGQPDDLDDMLD